MKGSVLDESGSGQTVYIEPAELVGLQMELASLQAEESREEMKILGDLTSLAESYNREIALNTETVGILDFLFAKAKYAATMDGRTVQVNTSGRITLQQARHPLMGASMIPLDFAIGRDYSSLIITGPNTGGKTVALKTLGLLTLMMQSGLLVPVGEGGEMAVYHEVAVDIGDGQSLEQALSTFSAHIRNMIGILEQANSSSLVLIDEMASGTDPGEGLVFPSPCWRNCTAAAQPWWLPLTLGKSSILLLPREDLKMHEWNLIRLRCSPFTGCVSGKQVRVTPIPSP